MLIPQGRRFYSRVIMFSAWHRVVFDASAAGLTLTCARQLTRAEVAGIPNMINLRIISNVLYFIGRAIAKEDTLEALTSRILARQLKLDAVVSGWMRTVESTSHLRKWAEGWLTSTEQEALAEKLGPLLYFETELPSGHYALDLADPRGQHIAANLQRMGNAERQRRKKRDLSVQYVLMRPPLCTHEPSPMY